MISVEKIQALLFHAVKETIEEMGFLEVEKAPKDVDTRTLECVSIQTIKPFLGRLYFFFAPELKYEIVRNLYGKEVVAEKEAQDAILEVLNVITGGFLTQLTENKDYEMEFPSWEYRREEFQNIVTNISLFVEKYEARCYMVREGV